MNRGSYGRRPSTQTCERCGREGSHGFMTRPDGSVVCASEKACQARIREDEALIEGIMW